MISSVAGMILGREDRPGHGPGPHDASRSSRVQKTLQFSMFLRPTELLSFSSLRDLFKDPHQRPDCVFFLRKYQWLWP